MTTYAIHATVRTHNGTWSGSKSVPTFYLDSRVQGITSAIHAADIARSILNPLGTIPAGDLVVGAYQVDPERESAELAASEHDRAVEASPEHAEWCAGAGAHHSAMLR